MCLDHGTAMHVDPFKRAAGCPGGEVGGAETGRWGGTMFVRLAR